MGVAVSRVLHAHGLLRLRTREVRRLAVGHVDHKARSIDVVDSKAGRSRRLPVGDEVAAELLECDQRSRERFGDDRPAFFVTSTGNPVSPGMPAWCSAASGRGPGSSGHKPANGPGPMISGTGSRSRTSSGGLATAWT